MKAKRFILMLLILVSVTGAMAQNNVIRYTATEDLVGVFRSLGEVMSSVYDPNTHEGVVTFTNDITTIPRQSFFQSSLISIDLPASITSIELYAFHNCTSLTSVNLPESLTSIGEGAFFGCTSLTSVNLPASITSIELHAFDNCTSLTSVSIPAKVTSFGDAPFVGCNSLKTVTINSQQTLNATGYWTDDDHGQCGQGYIFQTFGQQVEEYILNGNITIIPGWKFFNCSITNITLPETLTEIKDNAFASSSLTSITIPASVTSICTYSFRECPLQSITVNATTPPTLDDSFSFFKVSTSIPVFVPKGTVDTYKAAGGWKYFTNFTEFCRLNLASSDSSLGKVYGAGMYATYTKATIFAIPEAGSKFMGWSDGSTENPRQYVVMEDASLTANFEPVKVFDDPVGAGMRLKVTKKNGAVYEFSTKDVKNVEHFEVTE